MKSPYHLLFIAVFTLASCQGILDKDPLGTLDVNSFFKTADDAVQAVNAAYEPLLFNNGNNNFYWAFGVVTYDEAIAGGDGSRAGIVELDFLTHTPRTSEFNDFWKLQYNGINQCNTVLEKLPGIDMDEALKNRILGEAYFLRAYYYFLLTQVYGDVPMLLKITPPDELKIPKTTKSKIYQQIVEDCEKAAAWLPAQHTGGNVGRATSGAAYALAAKTFVYEKNWAKALEYVAKVKALGVFALVPDYEDNFRKNTQNNSESVWEIQHANLELGVGNSLNQWWRSKKVQGYGFCEVTQEFVDAFEVNDPRRKFTVAKNNEDYFGFIYKNSYSSTRFSVKKYLQVDTTVTQAADGDINYTAIRYAEVLLWEAEALAELGQVAAAQVPLEAVRARARAQSDSTATALPMIVTTDKQEMIDAVRHERQVELGFEMHRFFDLVRWGIAKEKLPDFQVGKHEVFPLPQTELDLNPALLQNAGY
ncbi:MAG: RagB/SusD family nutrient uptake outer membrane protein [Saprospiraceae bacterium]|nr:RagB/SusD family nutrient uptake outer membrane protein [Saprospiraceae bacterium]MCF8250976.1 RagB/SusD family nutrient uptake outer membrane protein [Saprospiraceae bacterium]MCF8280305.1 RagB/SusD family nutrient uptake outer membrane protein [Bacteroidales bacterium]MCF8312832.1 RagB/SusD family nutrient uptake outer membrane protein [Saprospiraceae bacterium]MCF8441279.1 RagB/SusD family nutrient uptake outer membrane protein [Saprospiraceae bacterium]